MFTLISCIFRHKSHNLLCKTQTLLFLLPTALQKIKQIQFLFALSHLASKALAEFNALFVKVLYKAL